MPGEDIPMPGRLQWVDAETEEIPSHDEGEPPTWPPELLERHGLKVLLPAEVDDATPGAGPLRSTVYRVRTLLMPDLLLRHDKALDAISTAVGVDLDVPPPLATLDPDIGTLAQHMRELPRPVVLIPRTSRPVDAWDVLQQLRRAAAAGAFDNLDDEPDPAKNQSAALRAAARQISLEHGFIGTNWDPVPTGDPHGITDTVEISTRSGYGRRPATYLGSLPERPEPVAARRPVIAVLDTGYSDNTWLGTAGNAQGLPAGGFVRKFGITQSLIAAQAKHVAGLIRTDVLLTDWEERFYTSPITQLVAAATGHGTFIKGIIRQQAPGADVLTIRVLHPDSFGYESDVLLALWMLHARLADAQNRLADPASTENDKAAATKAVFDVVSFSLGFYDERPNDPRTTRLAEIVEKLTGAGVVVIAAAGNDSTARPFLPAALSAAPGNWPGQRVIGCGALNPNGTIAWFSNEGDNVSVYATGASVLSTFPQCVRGALGPYAGVIGRQGLDWDDYSCGFAVWSGTSFATPLVASRVANTMIAQVRAAVVPEWQLDDQSMRNRAASAIATLRAQP